MCLSLRRRSPDERSDIRGCYKTRISHCSSGLPAVACIVAFAPRNDEAGAAKQPDGQITSDLRKSCQAQNFRKSKIFLLPVNPNHLHIYAHPVPLRGASAVVVTRGGDAVDADGAMDGRSKGVR